ncbi:MAG TPA: FkbM family methyltransferase [Pirellulales bacterium]|nr:FkbM family methyltransferase [Pirellulales bacterium]
MAAALSRRADPTLSDQAKTEPEYPPTVYGERIPWEIPVQLCLRDVLREGDCALDVGANIGGVGIAMSRMVGASGSVHAFEANPRTLARLYADLAANHVTHVTVVPKAAWSTSGEHISFYCDTSYYAAGSSIYRREKTWQEVRVPTISLDDYCRVNRLAPKAVKLDVEGAEFDVLQGAQWILDRYSPAFVLEYHPAAERGKDTVELLRSRGYSTFDTNLYREVDRDFYLKNFEKVPTANVLAVATGSAAHTRYSRLSLVEEHSARCAGERTDWLALDQPGRFVVVADFEGPNETEAVLRVSDSDSHSLACFQTQVQYLKEHSCSHLVIDIDQPCQIRCELSAADSASATVALRNVRVMRVCFAPA